MNKNIKLSSFSHKIYASLLERVTSRNTPFERLDDFLDRCFQNESLRKEERVSLIAQTLSGAVIELTVEAMRASMVLAERELKHPYEKRLLTAQANELRKEAQLKIKQAQKLGKEKENEKKNKELLKARAKEARAMAYIHRTKGGLYCRQTQYYHSQAVVERAKKYGEVASMAFTRGLDVGKDVWANAKGYTDAIIAPANLPSPLTLVTIPSYENL